MKRLDSDEEKEQEPTLFEMLAPDELDRIFEMHDVLEARPCKVRSISISNEQPFKRNEKFLKNSFTNNLINKKHDEKKSLSICRRTSISTLQNTDYNKHRPRRKIAFNQTSFVKSSIDADDYEQVESLIAQSNDFTKLDFVSGRGIALPFEIFSQINRKGFNFSDKKESPILNHDKHFSDDFAKVESKLKDYLTFNRKKKRSSQKVKSVKCAKTAIETHRYASSPFIQYSSSNTNRLDLNNYLKFSQQLEHRIKEDLRKNKGPIYYAELRQENISIHIQNKKFGLYDKFYNVYEWLKTLDRRECAHFYQNPFQQDKSTIFDAENSNPDLFNEPSIVNSSDSLVSASQYKATEFSRGVKASEPLCVRNFATKKHQIDPFENPKNERVSSNLILLRNRLPQKRLSAVRSYNSQYETIEKKTLVAKKDLAKLLNIEKKFLLNEKSAQNRLKDEFVAQTKMTNGKYLPVIMRQKTERLNREKSKNDLILSRLELDLFIF